MAKIKGYKGWRKAIQTKTRKTWNFIVGGVKLGEATLLKKGRKIYAYIEYKAGELEGKISGVFDTFNEATVWLNKKKREVSKKVFG